MRYAEAIVDPGVPMSHLPFSPAVRVGPMVFVSGQASVDDTGKIVEDSFEGEMRRSYDNVRRILAAAGLGLEHVVQTRNYVDNLDDLPEFNRIYHELFKRPFPARTTLIGCLGGLLKFEVDVVAVARPIDPPRRQDR